MDTVRKIEQLPTTDDDRLVEGVGAIVSDCGEIFDSK